MSSVFRSSFNHPGARARAKSSIGAPSFIQHLAGWFAATTRATPATAGPLERRQPQQPKATLLATAESMLDRARAENLPLSIVVFDLHDLPELESVFGAGVAREVLVEVALRLQDIATGKGLVIRTGAAVFTVMMPGYGRDRAHLAIQKTLGSPCCIELRSDEHEIVLIPDFELHTVRSDSPSLEWVQRDLKRDIAQVQSRERRRRRHLQLERESHTRPMELRPDGARLSTAPSVPRQACDEETLPVPLRA